MPSECAHERDAFLQRSRPHWGIRARDRVVRFLARKPCTLDLRVLSEASHLLKEIDTRKEWDEHRVQSSMLASEVEKIVGELKELESSRWKRLVTRAIGLRFVS